MHKSIFTSNIIVKTFKLIIRCTILDRLTPTLSVINETHSLGWKKLHRTTCISVADRSPKNQSNVFRYLFTVGIGLPSVHCVTSINILKIATQMTKVIMQKLNKNNFILYITLSLSLYNHWSTPGKHSYICTLEHLHYEHIWYDSFTYETILLQDWFLYVTVIHTCILR